MNIFKGVGRRQFKCVLQRENPIIRREIIEQMNNLRNSSWVPNPFEWMKHANETFLERLDKNTFSRIHKWGHWFGLLRTADETCLRTDPNWKNGRNNVSLKHQEDKSGRVRIQFRIPRETGSDVVGFVS